MINAIVGALTLAFVGALLALQFANMRESVNEEVIAANRVAAQLLGRVVATGAVPDLPSMLAFLRELGRLRSNDLVLRDGAGVVLYESPPSPYKAGRDAPSWFAALVAPAPVSQSVEIGGATVHLLASPSRAVLDAWDRFSELLLVSAVLLMVVNVLVFWAVGRTVQPFARIVKALGDVEAGRMGTVLPRLRGLEAATIGAAFNRMVEALSHKLEAERQAARAERELSDSRELTRWIDGQIEQERLLIARELHDELGQSVTAIRSLALSVAQRTAGHDAEAERAARLIADESSRLYDAMHGLIPRLTPLVLDNFGLQAALDDLVERTHRSHAGLALDLEVDLPRELSLSAEAALALYRAAQEGITNALRHGRAPEVHLRLRVEDSALALDIADTGRGLQPGWTDRRGHHGLRWLAERAQGLGGSVVMQSGAARGALLQVRLPLNRAREAES